MGCIMRTNRTWLRVLAGITVLLLAALSTKAAPNRFGPTLDPMTYVSHNGAWTLHIDPSEPEGGGPGQFRVEQAGHLVWEREQPFTMWDASISDDGVVAGYAYDTGWYGWGASVNGPSHLFAIVLNSDGTERSRSVCDRRRAGVVCDMGPAYPFAVGVLTSPESNLFIVRQYPEWNSRTETWARYRLSDGAELAPLDLPLPVVANSRYQQVVSCTLIPGSNLVLVHWYAAGTTERPPFRAAHRSAHLTLETLDGSRIWERTFKDEYEGRGEYFDHQDLQREGFIQVGAGERSFWFHSFSQRHRVRFVIETSPQDPDSLIVTEQGSEVAGEPVQAGLVAIEDTVRMPIGTIELKGDPPGVVRQPIHSLTGFDVSRDGSFGLVRGARNDTAVLVTDQAGAILAQRAFAEVAGKMIDIAAIGGGRWLVYAGGYDSEKARAWVFDQNDADSAPEPLPELDVSALTGVEARPDGSFVGITGKSRGEVRAFDRRGKSLWTAMPFSVKDIALMDDGRIAVLHVVSKQISFLSSDGAELDGAIDLTKALGREPNYPAQLAADSENGLVLYDFRGEPAIYRLNADGTVRASLTPLDQHKQQVRTLGDPQVSRADGALWIAARNGLLRMDESGMPDRMFGEIAEARGYPLRGVGSLAVDAQGRLYASNRQNGRVHVFDGEGNLLRVLGNEADGVRADSWSRAVTVFDDGSTLVPGNIARQQGGLKDGFIEFNAEGHRTRTIPELLDDVAERRLAVPGSRSTWAVGYKKVALVDEHEQIVREIRRRPDGSWLGTTSDSAVARDGSIAVASQPDSAGFSVRCPCYLSVYDRAGNGLATLRIPVQSTILQIAFNGQTVALTTDDQVLLMDIKSGRTRRFYLPTAAGEEDYWYLATSASGKEFLALRSNSTQILRFPFE